MLRIVQRNYLSIAIPFFFKSFKFTYNIAGISSMNKSQDYQTKLARAKLKVVLHFHNNKQKLFVLSEKEDDTDFQSCLLHDNLITDNLNNNDKDKRGLNHIRHSINNSKTIKEILVIYKNNKSNFENKDLCNCLEQMAKIDKIPEGIASKRLKYFRQEDDKLLINVEFNEIIQKLSKEILNLDIKSSVELCILNKFGL